MNYLRPEKHAPRPDEAERRRFWSEALDRSDILLSAMSTYPVTECGEGFVSIRDAVESAGIEMLFSDTKIAGKFERIFFVREGIICDLIAIGRAMRERGWILKVEEGFRTQEMQTALAQSPKVMEQVIEICSWESGGGAPPLELIGKRTQCLVANMPCTGTHMCGAAIDVSIFQRDDGAEVWRGASYLDMNEKTPMISPFINQKEQEQRLAVNALMEEHRFYHYPGEFWHYNNGDALSQILAKTGRPGRYGPVHWDPDTNRIAPYVNNRMPLTSKQELAALVDSTVGRLHDHLLT